MDKLIEAAQHVVDEMERDYPIIGLLCRLKEALAAVRAHDAGTDERRIKRRVDRLLQWKLPENFNPGGGISFEKAISKDRPSWPQKNEPIGADLVDRTQAEQMVRYTQEGLPPASLPAGSAGTAQLDAEDQHPKMRAEPAEKRCEEEKVAIKMCKAAGMYEPNSTQISGMWTALGVAREGCCSQQDVEKAILAEARGFQVIPVDELPEFLKQALAPKPEPLLIERRTK